MAASLPALPSSMGSASVIDFIADSPFEISALVFSHLDNCDLKALRLTCKKVAGLACPRFKRVFISASPLNVRVFRAVAEHDTFRHDVREIIWDDARYEKPPPPDPQRFEDEYEDTDDEDERPPRGVPFWYFRHCKDNIEYLESRQFEDVKTSPQYLETSKQLRAQMPLDVAYAHYQDLVAQQDQVLSTSADIAAFEWAFEKDRFPNLKRITLTPAAHGILFKPLYPTPAIRALPYGFNYPLPRGWPAGYGENRSPTEPWDREESKSKWRGFLHVIKILARQESTKIPELVFDGNQVWSGLTCCIFNAREPCVEYDELVSVIKKPGFTTLILNLMATQQEDNNYLAFRNGRLRQALEADLRHFSLETDEEGSHENTPFPSHWVLDHFIPLRSIFPVEAWKNLAHFGLSRFLVKQQDLLDFLSALPQTLQSVELSFLWFMNNNGNYRELLFGIRDDLGWQKRTVRPRLLVRDHPYVLLAGRAVWLEDELQEFLYNDGENPYGPPSLKGTIVRPGDGPPSPTLRYGFGKEKDAFDPRFERPFESEDELIRLGTIRNWRAEYV